MEVEKQTDRRLKQQECDMHVRTLTVNLSRLSVTGTSAVALSEPEDLQGRTATLLRLLDIVLYHLLSIFRPALVRHALLRKTEP